MNEQFEHEGFVVEITLDDDPWNPRAWEHNMGTLVMMKDGDFEGSRSQREDELDRIARLAGKEVVLPVYRYEHSMVALSTESFIGRAHHAEWDSGLTGFIYTTRERIRENYGIGRVTKNNLDRAVEELKREVEQYGSYLNGECFVVQIFDPNDEEPDNYLDSCSVIGYEEAVKIGKEMAHYEATGEAEVSA